MQQNNAADKNRCGYMNEKNKDQKRDDRHDLKMQKSFPLQRRFEMIYRN